MSLDRVFRRLSLRSSKLCHQCRRSLASTPFLQQPQSATEAFSKLMQEARTPPPSPRPSQPPSTPQASTNVAKSSHDFARATILESTAAGVRKREQDLLADAERTYTRQDLERQLTRKFKPGDVYAPHDLTGVEMEKWRKVRRSGERGSGKKKVDVVDQLGFDPREQYKNFSMMSEYMTDMGRIKHSRETGLRPRNQRRMAKAIRRAIGMGLMPGVHRHPEIIKEEMRVRSGLL